MASAFKPWSKEEIAFLTKLCEEGKTRNTDLPKFFSNRSRSAISWKINDLGLKNKCIKSGSVKYNTKYFKEITLENTYWAGILVTDGCLYFDKFSGYDNIQWAVAVQDKSLMDKFISNVNSTNKIHHFFRKCSIAKVNKDKIFEQCSVKFGGSEWISDLEKNFGFTHNKTRRFPPPNLPSREHKLAFLRGLLDGDGTIISFAIKTKNKDKIYPSMLIQLCGVNRDLILWFKEFVESLNLPRSGQSSGSNISVDKRSGNLYSYRINGLQAAILFEILNRLPTAYLERKWNNPEVIAVVDSWKARKDIWPSPIFFENVLKTPAPLLPISQIEHYHDFSI